MNFIGNENENLKYEFSKVKLMEENDIKFVKIDAISKQTEDEHMIRFNMPMDYDPGQFFQVSVLGVGEAPMSICSYSKDHLEISVRNVGRVTSSICKLKKGDVVGLRGPYGKGYPMKDLVGNDIIIVGGGSGVAPVRGIIEYIRMHREKFGKVNLFFGFRGMMNMLFTNDFKNWENADMDIEVVFSGESNHPIYKKKGWVTDVLDAPCTESNDKKIVFVCGPPVMIESVSKKLIDKGFHLDQIFISEERHMKCGVGRCGHCMIGGKYCCTDGPVFRYDEIHGGKKE